MTGCCTADMYTSFNRSETNKYTFRVGTSERSDFSVPGRGFQRGATVPLQEVITTPLVSEMESPQIRIIDFGVCK